MERQRSFAQAEYAQKKKTTRRERFLNEMEQVVPWARLVACIEPHYFKGERGRKPVGIERMLRMYFLQQWYALADEALEDALYDSQAMRSFVGIDLGVESVPDATTLLKFRHLLERHALPQEIFKEINAHLSERNLLMREGTIIDATIIAAPSSTKNAKKERDPQMHQTKKGNMWHFGMKAHIGADAESGLVHTLIGTAANVADIACARELLHGEEKASYVDAGYTGIEKREEEAGETGKRTWYVALKRGKIKKMVEEDGGGGDQGSDLPDREAQSAGTGEGGAPFSCGEEPFWVSQGALPRAPEEHGSTPHALWPGEPSAGQAGPTCPSVRTMNRSGQNEPQGGQNPTIKNSRGVTGARDQ